MYIKLRLGGGGCISSDIRSEILFYCDELAKFPTVLTQMKSLNMVIAILLYFSTFTHRKLRILYQTDVKSIRRPFTSNVAHDVGFPMVNRKF